MTSYKLTPISIPPLSDGVFSHNGTGEVSGMAHVMDPATVAGGPNDVMKLDFLPYRINVACFHTGSPDQPNWFGVSYRAGVTSFETINLFCHPHPGHAHMSDADYQTRSGNWPRLFRYAEVVGRQVAIAQKNYVTVIPFFSNASYGDGGMFTKNWKDVLGQILVQVRSMAHAAAGTGLLPGMGSIHHIAAAQAANSANAGPKNLILSCFSRGRDAARVIHGRAAGIGGTLRELWDFDGIGGSMPGAPRIIHYDRQPVQSAIDTFHLPPHRFAGWSTNVSADGAHGLIIAFMVRHAAAISRAP